MATRVLLSMGGADNPTARSFMEAVADEPSLASCDVRRLVGIEDVGPELEAADLALAAAGTTAWELCAFGVPSVLVATSENQVDVASSLEGAGAAVFAGMAQPERVAEVAAEVHALARSERRRREIQETCAGLVDGTGAIRVATWLRSMLLEVRPAAASDARRLWKWSNDPETRMWSFTPRMIERDEHLAWLDGVLGDPAHGRLYIVLDKGVPVGQVRFDVQDEDAARPSVAEVSVSVAPESRGQGLAGPVICAASRRFLGEVGVQKLVARVMPDNARSLRAFQAADFDERGDASSRWRELVRPRQRGVAATPNRTNSHGS
jgi:RimJ/RimL family protein N-acetyltransferase